MAADWVVVYSSNKIYEIEFVKALLADNDIEGITMNKQDSAYLFGEIEVYVATDDALKARQLIIKFKGE